jgi:predicted O-methyltransferase YrrM
MDINKLLKESDEEDKIRGLKYTTNWFHGPIKYDFDRHITLNKSGHLKLLEIGAFEGKSTVWLIDTYLSHEKSKIDIIDPFLISDVTTQLTNETFNLFQDNLKLSNYPEKFLLFMDLSSNVLPKFIAEKRCYDLIFIDGSHLRRDIIVDLVLSWKMLKVNSFLVMDDYANEGGAVKDCLHFWLNCLNRDEWSILHDRYQVIVHKLK